MKRKSGKATTDGRFRVARARVGLGLFAVEPIERGSHVIDFIGKRISTASSDKMRTRNLFEIDEKWTINGSTRANTARYINHSCRPNCVVRKTRQSIRIFARRNIPPGEELTYDYGKDYFDGFIAPVGCKCLHCAPTKATRRAAGSPRRRARS